jgi:hypothetical protein
MKSRVIVSKSALFEMLLAGVEAYTIKHDKHFTVAIETYAHLWGKINSSGAFKCEIDHVSVETSAAKTRGDVTAKDESLSLKKDIAKIFKGGFQYIGTFHSHPYVIPNEVRAASDIRKERLFEFSDGDHESEISCPEIYHNSGEYSVALVMTICAVKKANDIKDGEVDESAFEFSLGNFKFWLKAQVYQHLPTSSLNAKEIKAFEKYKLKFEEQLSETLPVPIDTFLECEMLANFGFYKEDFGRIEMTTRKAIYKNINDSEIRF